MIQNLDKILDLTDSIQEEWLKFSEELMKHAKSKKRKIHYADLKDVFLMTKIADLQNQINILQEWKLNKEGV